MQKGESLYKVNCPIYFTPPQPILEEWLPINIEGVKPYYLISNYGRVYNRISGKFIRPAVDSKGYLYHQLATFNGQSTFRVHRLEMMVFCYFPGCENLLINHKDGIKTNNMIWNLEWSTYSENIIHAYMTGLNGKTDQYNSDNFEPEPMSAKDCVIKYMEIEEKEYGVRRGENSASSSINNEIAREICEYLQAGMKTKEIANKLGITSAIVQQIANGKTWKNISKDYKFEPQNPQAMTDEQIHYLCQCFVNDPKRLDCNIKEYCKYILNKYNILGKGVSPNETQLRTATTVFRRVKYTRISDNYNF